MNTVSYLMKHCFHSERLFSGHDPRGINIYLTLAIAQTLLRAGDPGYRQLVANRGRSGIADRAVARGHPSLHQGRLYGGRTARLGGG